MSLTQNPPPEIIVRYCWEDRKADRFELQVPISFLLTGGRAVAVERATPPLLTQYMTILTEIKNLDAQGRL